MQKKTEGHNNYPGERSTSRNPVYRVCDQPDSKYFDQAGTHELKGTDSDVKE